MPPHHPAGTLGHLAGWIMAARRSNRARNAWTLELLEIAPAHRVLELGFGPGYAISLLAPRLTTGCLVGLDHSAAMLAQARRRNTSWIADGRVQLVLGGTEALATLPRGFDRVYSANLLQFVPDREALLRSLLSLLVPGGRIGTTYKPRHPGAVDADALRFAETLIGQMRATGYVDCRIEKNPHHGVLTVCVLGRKP
jgi:ubiquinone/menaquinone biosynthesis C-methylase UbiE